jgi:DNA-3-methyladenine glycosylase I
MEPHRCPWAKGDKYIQYHDTEWGVSIHDDRLLFEFLVLEGAQAGLSWSTILNKRDNYRQVWSFVGHRPIQNAWKSMQELPARTPESDAMSADLKRRGFKFVGSTICYAYMQAVGMVKDPMVDCFRHRELTRTRRGKKGR